MRAICCAAVLGVVALGLLGLTPTSGNACDRRFYGAAFAPAPLYGRPVTLYAPSQTYAPRYHSAPAPPYSSGYYAPPQSPAYAAPASQPAAPTGYGAAPAQSPEQPTTFVRIGMHDDRFVPPMLTVKPGTTVRWVNLGQHRHTVTARNNSWDSGELAPGESYSLTFKREGTYTYRCTLHRGMEGTIVVEGAPGRVAAGR